MFDYDKRARKETEETFRNLETLIISKSLIPLKLRFLRGAWSGCFIIDGVDLGIKDSIQTTLKRPAARERQVTSEPTSLRRCHALT
jgi:hypothetical protein